MKTPAKVGIVVGGYAGAILIAMAGVAAHVALTNPPIAQASSGMNAAGDSLMFLGVFGLAAIPATCAAMYFLRPHLLFWRIFSLTALAISATAVVALMALAIKSWAGDSVFRSYWDLLAVLRIPLTPLFAIAFCVAGLFAPNRSSRISLFVAMFVEGAVFSVIVFRMLLLS